MTESVLASWLRETFGNLTGQERPSPASFCLIYFLRFSYVKLSLRFDRNSYLLLAAVTCDFSSQDGECIFLFFSILVSNPIVIKLGVCGPLGVREPQFEALKCPLKDGTYKPETIHLKNPSYICFSFFFIYL